MATNSGIVIFGDRSTFLSSDNNNARTTVSNTVDLKSSFPGTRVLLIDEDSNMDGTLTMHREICNAKFMSIFAANNGTDESFEEARYKYYEDRKSLNSPFFTLANLAPSTAETYNAQGQVTSNFGSSASSTPSDAFSNFGGPTSENSGTPAMTLTSFNSGTPGMTLTPFNSGTPGMTLTPFNSGTPGMTSTPFNFGTSALNSTPYNSEIPAVTSTPFNSGTPGMTSTIPGTSEPVDNFKTPALNFGVSAVTPCQKSNAYGITGSSQEAYNVGGLKSFPNLKRSWEESQQVMCGLTGFRENGNFKGPLSPLVNLPQAEDLPSNSSYLDDLVKAVTTHPDFQNACASRISEGSKSSPQPKPLSRAKIQSFSQENQNPYYSNSNIFETHPCKKLDENLIKKCEKTTAKKRPKIIRLDKRSKEPIFAPPQKCFGDLLWDDPFDFAGNYTGAGPPKRNYSKDSFSTPQGGALGQFGRIGRMRLPKNFEQNDIGGNNTRLNLTEDGVKKFQEKSKPHCPHTGQTNNGPNSTTVAANKCGVVLKRGSYYCVPDIDMLNCLLSSEGTCLIRDFEIGHVNWGHVVFPGITNVTNLNLDEIVEFGEKKLELYKDEESMPALGTGLNKEAIVTLRHVWPKIDPTQKSIKASSYENCLKRSCQRFGGQFISYSPEAGIWTFKVFGKEKKNCEVK